MTDFDVIGFGALNIDVLYRVNRIAKIDQESFATDYRESCGGSAANTMVGLARLGCRVGYVGKIAGDREGNLHLREFRKEEVDTQGISVVDKGRSGRVMGFIDPRGDRALYVDSGVNDYLSFRDINMQYASNTKYVHLSSFVGTKPLNAQKKLVAMLDKKVKVSFDPGNIYARLGPTKILPLIRRSYVMMPNANEVEAISGKSNYRAGASCLIEKGVEIVAVKLGSKGCYVTDGKQAHLIEAFKVKAVDTTGAGDAFCAGFLYGLLKYKGLLECGRIANFVASRSVTQVGARDGLPHLKDLMLLC